MGCGVYKNNVWIVIIRQEGIMMHCLRYIESYGHSSIPVEGFSKNLLSQVSTQVQGDVYTHVIWTVMNTSVCLYTGMLNCENYRVKFIGV